MQNGVLTGARMVMAREMQPAATRIERHDGVTTTLDNVVASSCQVFHNTGRRPTRARRITHDTLTRQMHFEGAQFRFMGLPLMWLPSLRLPDPTVRAVRGAPARIPHHHQPRPGREDPVFLRPRLFRRT